MMENRRGQKWDYRRRSQSRRPPRASWQPTVPSWEKQFCKVVGLMNWETLLQIKKFMYLYENVVNWNDSAGEEAFCNAKQRFWADINGFSCDIPLPDPDLYIDQINWDEDIDAELLADLEREPVITEAERNHDPVVIFGDALFPSQSYSLPGWGDNAENIQQVPTKTCTGWEQNWVNNEENIQQVLTKTYTGWEQNWVNNEENIQQVPTKTYTGWEQNWVNNEENIQQVPTKTYTGWEQNWVNNEENIQQVPTNSYTGWEQNWVNNEENIQQVPTNSYTANHVDSWEQNWGNSFSNEAATGWPDYGNNARQFSDHGHGPAGYATGWNDDGNWNYTNYNLNYEVGPDSKDMRANEERGWWNDGSNAATHAEGYMLTHKTSRVQGHDRDWNRTVRNDRGRRESTYLGDQSTIDNRRSSRKWNSHSSRPPVSHKAPIAVGRRRER